jgi:beta-lactamase class A
MKNPKSLYVSSASRLKGKRQVRNILLLILAIVALLGLFMVLYVAQAKKKIDEAFPSGLSASSESSAMTTLSEPTQPPTLGSDESSASETTPPPESTGATEPGDTTGGSTTVSNKPVYPPPETDVFFEYSNLLQTVTHKDRDIAFAKLKQSVREYTKDSPGTRIGFYYTNLKSTEEFGNGDLDPFIVGGAINLPINLILYDEARTGVLSMLEVLEYEEFDKTDGTGEITLRDVGAQFYIRTLSNLSLSSSDNIATAMILRRLGGIENVAERFAEISAIVDYNTLYNYIDYSMVQQYGDRRSGAQDLARYARELYYRYLMYPDHYQPMINDLALNSSVFSGVFEDGTQIFSKSGINTKYKSSAEVAILICQEPIVLCVTVESDSPDYSATVMADLGKMVADYIRFCYT